MNASSARSSRSALAPFLVSMIGFAAILVLPSVGAWGGDGEDHPEPAASDTAAAADESAAAAETTTPDEVDGDAAAKHTIAWEKDYDAALARATELGRTVLVDFGAEWCGWCKKMDRDTFENAKVIEVVRDHFIALKVDVDVTPALKEKYAIEGLPTLLFLSSGGKEMQRFEGYMGPDVFLERASKAAASSKTLTDLGTAAKTNPDDIDAQRAYARALFAVKNVEEARVVLANALERQPDHAGLLLDAADVQRSAGKLAEAKKVYERLLALPEGSAEIDRTAVHLAHGKLLVSMKEFRPAIEQLSHYLERVQPAEGADKDNSAIWEAHFWRGYAHSVLKDAPAALADLRTVREKDQGHWGLRANYIIEIVAP
jgi:thiol-disulfide isomerase/thioredoxin